ncbi:MAG: toprim domain-containing protein [Rhodocyclaceae bacterium]|nr:toprim domain-containing protein [Rhodocyclaceae bacterium]
MSAPDVKVVKQIAEGRWDEILPGLAPSIAHAFGKKLGRHVACPHHAGKSEANFRAFRNVAVSGGVVCNSCGTFASGIDTLMWANNWSFAEAVKEVDKWLGGVRTLSPAELARQAALQEKRRAAAKRARIIEDKRSRASLNAVWRASVPLDHPSAAPARLYFANRGLSLQSYSPEMRFHPALNYIHTDEDEAIRSRHPAIVTRVRTADGKPGTLHRTYITVDGQKLRLGVTKKLMSHPSDVSLTGGAIRLMPATRTIGVAEGIETAYAAMELFGINVWPCVSRALLESFEPPPNVEKVVVFGDLDASGDGQRSAQALVERLWANGIMAGLRLPEGPIPAGSKGVDWNDVLQGQKFARTSRRANGAGR